MQRATSTAPALSSSASGLELELPDLETERRAASVSSKIMDTSTVADIAGFGKAEPGTIGALAYWLRVRKRLREIAGELAAAEKTRDSAFSNRVATAAELGRSVHQLGIQSVSLIPLISAALSTENTLKTREFRRGGRLSEHTQYTESIEREIRSIESCATPYRTAEKRLLEEKKEIETKKRGFETTRKRVQIDLQNTDSLLSQKRLDIENAAGFEKEKRSRDIALLETRRRSLLDRIVSLDGALLSLVEPASDVQSNLEKARAEIAPYNEKHTALKARIEAATTQFAKEDNLDAEAAETEAERMSLAWAEVGQQAIKENARHSSLEAEKAAAVTAIREAREAESTVEMLKRAEDGYDRKAVQTAKRTVIAAVVIAALLVVVLIFV